MTAIAYPLEITSPAVLDDEALRALWNASFEDSLTGSVEVRMTHDTVMRAISDNENRRTLLALQRRLGAELPAQTLAEPLTWASYTIGGEPVLITQHARICAAEGEDPLLGYQRLGRSLRALHGASLKALNSDEHSALAEIAEIWGVTPVSVNGYSVKAVAEIAHDAGILLTAAQRRQLAAPALIHGDMHLENQIDGVLIDLDTLTVGSPAYDVLQVLENFMRLRSQRIRPAAFDFDASVAAFLTAYLGA